MFKDYPNVLEYIYKCTCIQNERNKETFAMKQTFAATTDSHAHE